MSRRNHYSNDPRWITAKYAGQCRGCGIPVKKGDRAFYYPATNAIYCERFCGPAAERDFHTCIEAEEGTCYP